jgi:hypothetical protein
MKVYKPLRLNSIVKFDSVEDLSEIFDKRDTFIYLGDIAQMPGHCIVIRMGDGTLFYCIHTDNFVEVPEEEC